MSSSSSDVECTPPELQEAANVAINNLFPAKSKEKYLKAYENFMKWRNEKKVNTFSENIFLAYFSELAKSKMPSSLWAIYSMVKFTVNVKHNVNIKNFSNLTAFLKRQSDGFKSKKSNVLTSENITQFLNEAPDDRYLATKIALILGVNGACRSTELYNLTKNDVTYHDDVILVKLRDTKTKIDRMFVIKNEYISIMEKYRALRPASATSDKFFLQFRNGKCFNQVIGRHKISTFPKEVAIFLNLANTEMYTGHCFRRTSATLLADAGANLLTMKRHGGWKSEKVVEGYIAESVTNKSHINDAINKRINYSTNVDQPSTSRQESNPQASYSLSSEQPAAAWNKPQTSTFSPTSVSSQPANSPSITNTQHEIQQTNINLPGQSITLTFQNCTNNNMTFNFK
ncbi:uncharacterized protein [Choristoneura fumiferana]|uniref:uncharacterized protein n=1 Tax=Choristoneura fumiferana TaxID=7141 RepID=UPI003D15C2C3